MTSQLLEDALAISDAWRAELDLRDLIHDQLGPTGALDESIDIVAIGKASRSMTEASRGILGSRIQRVFMVVDNGTTSDDGGAEVIVGEHPLPGEGSIHAGGRLIEFLAARSDASCTLFLISGGASSLCARPEAPIDLQALHELFESALKSGMDITALNQLRAATSSIAGGAVLRLVRTPRSMALIMVDNVISGARFVASGLTYDYQPSTEDITKLVENRLEEQLAAKVLEASARRRTAMRQPVRTAHENHVVAEPALLLDATVRSAERHGYRVVRWGSDVRGYVHDATRELSQILRDELVTPGPFCVVGVGEVTVRVRGSGKGGRCQEFAWAMAERLATFERPGVFVARASDGRDFVEGVAGGWVDNLTTQRASALGIDWSSVAARNDTFSGLTSLGQLLPGSSTGWNLCDLYLTLFE